MKYIHIITWLIVYWSLMYGTTNDNILILGLFIYSVLIDVRWWITLFNKRMEYISWEIIIHTFLMASVTFKYGNSTATKIMYGPFCVVLFIIIKELFDMKYNKETTL